MPTLEDLPPKIRDILRQLREGLAEMYGDRLRGLVLFGSWARGDAEEDSDIDVLVVLDEADEPYGEVHRMMDVVYPLCLDNDVVISAIPMPERDFRERRSPLLMNIRKEGLAA
jgi:predicted nucleotidyltransferase